MSVCGSPTKDVYTRFVNDDGSVCFKVTGKHNLDAEIQSHRLDCDVNFLVQRYVQGDVSALDQVRGSFGDFTGFPKTYAEMLNSVHEAESAFMHLPVELRAKFDHSFEKFFTSLDQKDTVKILQDFYHPAKTDSIDPVAVIAEEVSPDES